MTAPDKIWVNECDYTQCTDGYTPTGIEYTRTASIPTDARLVTDNALRESIARAWCHEVNAAKEMDADLAEAVLLELRAIIGENDNDND